MNNIRRVSGCARWGGWCGLCGFGHHPVPERGESHGQQMRERGAYEKEGGARKRQRERAQMREFTFFWKALISIYLKLLNIEYVDRIIKLIKKFLN